MHFPMTVQFALFDDTSRCLTQQDVDDELVFTVHDCPDLTMLSYNICTECSPRVHYLVDYNPNSKTAVTLGKTLMKQNEIIS